MVWVKIDKTLLVKKKRIFSQLKKIFPKLNLKKIDEGKSYDEKI